MWALSACADRHSNEYHDRWWETKLPYNGTGVPHGFHLQLPYLYDKLQGARVRQVVRPAAVHDVQRLHLNAVPMVGGRGQGAGCGGGVSFEVPGCDVLYGTRNDLRAMRDSKGGAVNSTVRQAALENVQLWRLCWRARERPGKHFIPISTATVSQRAVSNQVPYMMGTCTEPQRGRRARPPPKARPLPAAHGTTPSPRRLASPLVHPAAPLDAVQCGAVAVRPHLHLVLQQQCGSGPGVGSM